MAGPTNAEIKAAATRNILENSKKLEWEIADRSDVINKKLEDMAKVRQKGQGLPELGARGRSQEVKDKKPDHSKGKTAHISTKDTKIKIIGHEKTSKVDTNAKDGGYYYPESVMDNDREKKLATIPNAYERKKIREDIKIILDHNFNVDLTTKKKTKPTGKLAPVADKDKPEGIVKFIEKDYEDFESRGKYDRKVFRRRSQVKAENKNVITEDDIKEENKRNKLRKDMNARKEPGMADMVGKGQTLSTQGGVSLDVQDYENALYLDNLPANKKKNFEPGEREEVYRTRNRNGEKFFVVVYLVINGPDGIGWRSYIYDLYTETSQIIDLKILVEKDLGYPYQNQHYFFNLKEISDNTDLSHLDFKCDIWSQDCIALIMIPSAEPVFNKVKNVRGKYLPMVVTDYFPDGGAFAKSTEDFLSSNILKALVYPPNRDWTTEFYINYNQVKTILKEVKIKDKETTTKKFLGPKLSDVLLRLSMHVKGMQKTIDEFEQTAMKCIEVINRWDVKPHEINFLYGVGGLKYVMGGLLIKECKFIYTLGRKVEKIEIISEMVKHKIEMLNFIRNSSDKFLVPLVSSFEYYGRFYIVYAASPIDLNTLVYGTITQNLVIMNDLNDYPPLQDLVKALNLNFHYVYESGQDTYKPIYGTSNWEIHRVKEKLYVTDVDRLLPLDFAEESEINLDSQFIANFLPMEVVQSSVSRQIDDVFRAVKSRDTFKCSECREYIPDQEYYTYDKNRTQTGDMSQTYACCVSDYQKKSVYHDLKVSVKKLGSKPKKFRAISLGNFYIHTQTGELIEHVPYQKVPLNPDFIETDDIPSEIASQIKTDRLNIKYLSNNMRSHKSNEIAQLFQKFEEDIGSCKDICKLMKKKGLPLRYLGKVAESCDKNFAKEIIVREMIAQAMSFLLIGSFEYLRRIASEMKEYNLKKNIAFHMNSLLGNQMTEDAKTVWKAVINYVQFAFDTVVEINVKEKVHLPGLLIRILDLIDAKLIVNLEDIDFSDPEPFKIGFFEIFHPRVAY